jgi:hypothetical protein
MQTIMRGWNLARAERISMWARLLFELSANPDRLLHEAIRRPNVWAYRFFLGSAPSRRFFSFVVERRDYSAELWVVDGQLTFEEGLLPPPS